jgi:hypothetical protein
MLKNGCGKGLAALAAPTEAQKALFYINFIVKLVGKDRIMVRNFAVRVEHLFLQSALPCGIIRPPLDTL